jgi:hypothetical protein
MEYGTEQIEADAHAFFDRIAWNMKDPFRGRLKVLNYGSTRIVYVLNDHMVVKVPMTEGHTYYNEREARLYSKDDPRMPWCKLVGPYLVMEKIEPLYEVRQGSTEAAESLPDWARDTNLMIDSPQVGRTMDGRIVVYDAGGYEP